MTVATAVLYHRNTLMATIIATAACIVVLTYRGANPDGSVADKVNLAFGIGGTMTGIMAAILAWIQAGDTRQQHREILDAINRISEMQSKASAELRSQAELDRIALQNLVKQTIRAEMRLTRGTGRRITKRQRKKR